MFGSWRALARFQFFAVVMLGLFMTPRTSFAQNAATESLNTANGLLARGLYDLAATEYTKCLDANPGSEQAQNARYGLAVCLFRSQKYSEALKQLDQIDAKTGFPFVAETLAMKGQCHLAAQEYDNAVPCFERILKEYATHELADDAAAMLCETLYRQGKAKETTAACADFVRRWPDSPLRERAELVWGLSELANSDAGAAAKRLAAWIARYPKSADFDRALLSLAQAEQAAGLPEAITHYRAVIARPDSPFIAEATLGLAGLLREKGQNDEAAKLLDSLSRVATTPATAAAAELQRAKLLVDSGKLEDAQRVFEKLTANNDAYGCEAGYWAAKCALRMGKTDDALNRLHHLIEANPQSNLIADMRYDYLVALVRSAKPEEAERGLNDFRAAYPKHELAVDALYLTAVVQHQRKNFDASRAACVEYLKAAGKRESKSNAAFLLAENDYLAGHLPEAIAGFERFERDYPKDSQATAAAMRIGLILYRQGKLDEAAKRLSPMAGAAEKDESLRPVLQALGDIAFSRGEWKIAEQHLRRIVETGPSGLNADDAWLKLGLSCERQERYADALGAFDNLVEKFPQSEHRLQALFERGQCLLMDKRFDQAKEALKIVIREGKDSRFARPANEHLATIATQNKDYAAAARHYQLAADTAGDTDGAALLLRQGEALLASGEYAAAEKTLKSFISAKPRAELRVRAQAGLAIAVARQDRADDALRAIAGLDTNEIAQLSAPLRNSLLHDEAWCLRKLGREKEAADVFRALLCEPDGERDWRAVLGLAEIDASAERFAEAAQALLKLQSAARDANAVSPVVLEPALYRLGICEFRLKQFPQSATTLDALLTSFPQSKLAASAAYFSGESHAQAGTIDKAVERFTFVVEKFQQDAAYAPSLLRLGECLATLQRWPASEKVFRDYLAGFSSDPQAYQARFGVGWALENAGKHDEARKAYEEVIAGHKGPTAARAQFQIGECLFAAKKYEDAVKEFLKVDILYAYPEWSAAALYEAGRCFDQLGKSAEAKKSYESVASQYKETKWAALASQRLNTPAVTGLPGH